MDFTSALALQVSKQKIYGSGSVGVVKGMLIRTTNVSWLYHKKNRSKDVSNLVYGNKSGGKRKKFPLQSSCI